MTDLTITYKLFLIVLFVFIFSKIFSMLWELITFPSPSFKEDMKDIEKSYKIKEQLMEVPGVKRVMFFSSHNSGHKLTRNTPIMVSSLWGSSPHTAEYKSLHVDFRYIQVLHEAHQAGFTDFYAEEEKPCLLKTIYKRDDIGHTRIFYIGENYESTNILGRWLGLKGKTIGLYFISIGCDEELGSEEKYNVERLISELRKLYK